MKPFKVIFHPCYIRHRDGSAFFGPFNSVKPGHVRIFRDCEGESQTCFALFEDGETPSNACSDYTHISPLLIGYFSPPHHTLHLTRTKAKAVMGLLY